MRIYVIIALLMSSVTSTRHYEWKWICDQNQLCIRIKPSGSNSTNEYDSIEACRLVCGKYGAVWPHPTVLFAKSNILINVDVNKIYFDVINDGAVKDYIYKNIEIFKQNVVNECNGKSIDSVENGINVEISVASNDFALNWNTNETYEIFGKGSKWSIRAQTIYGARHGLETLSQLIAAVTTDRRCSLVIVKDVAIKDTPIYPHRSLLLDTARNYLDIATIKRQIDGMAASKMNILHWHATDSQSFPYVSQKVPNMAIFGAYSEEKVYSPADVKDIIKYAQIRGVRVIMELDAPAHAGNGWQWGPRAGLGNLAVCVNQEPWRSYCIQPPCGQLNPANQNVYLVLESLYNDIVSQFSSDIFHMGGDEVFLACWNSTAEIIDYLKEQGKGQSKNDFLDLWGEFQKKALEKYDKAVGNENSNILMWSSELTNPEVIEKYLDKNRYVIETWVPSTDPLPQDLLKMGYKLIISTKNAWYLDHGFWGVTKYYTWRTAYSNKILKHKNVLGGEVCMWGELVDSNSIDSRVWPRAAAAAERLWSDPITDTKEAEPRMHRHRTRLVTRGIGAETLTPYWCHQNEGQCL